LDIESVYHHWTSKWDHSYIRDNWSKDGVRSNRLIIFGTTLSAQSPPQWWIIDERSICSLVNKETWAGSRSLKTDWILPVIVVVGKLNSVEVEILREDLFNAESILRMKMRPNIRRFIIILRLWWLLLLLSSSLLLLALYFHNYFQKVGIKQLIIILKYFSQLNYWWPKSGESK
jgi:hypothetical protein